MIDEEVGPHGYVVRERHWKRKIFDKISNNGIEHALSIYDRLDVLKALGGEEYGAKITPNSITTTVWFNNPGKLGISTIEDLLPLMESLGITFTHSEGTLMLLVTHHRAIWSEAIKKMHVKSWQIHEPFHYATLADLEADPYWTTPEKAQIRAEFNRMNPGDPDKAWVDHHTRELTIVNLYKELNMRGFKQHEI